MWHNSEIKAIASSALNTRDTRESCPRQRVVAVMTSASCCHLFDIKKMYQTVIRVIVGAHELLRNTSVNKLNALPVNATVQYAEKYEVRHLKNVCKHKMGLHLM